MMIKCKDEEAKLEMNNRRRALLFCYTIWMENTLWAMAETSCWILNGKTLEVHHIIF